MENSQTAGDTDLPAPSRPVRKDRLSRIEAIAAVLKVEPSFFHEPKPDLVELDMAVVSGLLATAEGRRLASAYLRIQEPDRRESVLTLVAFMSEDRASTA